MDERELQRVLKSMGVEILPNRAWQLQFHLDAVLRANEHFNLTSVRDADEAVALHILDSISASHLVAEAPEGALVDLGSGAGYPGIPLAIVSGRPTVLVESTGKKANFLAAVARALDHEIEVYPGRAENLALVRPAAFAVATARALGELPLLLELSAPLLSMGGLLIAYKGSPDEDELRRGRAVAEIVGLRETRRTNLVVPGLGAQREALVFEKVSEPTVSLPRRPGQANRRPLA